MNEAINYAKEIIAIHGRDDEQVEAHMESEGFDRAEIDAALFALELRYANVFERVIVAPAN